MRIDRPPYWYWPFDRWNLLVALFLLFAFIVAGVRGCGAPAPSQGAPTITQPAAGATLDYAAPGAVVGRATPGAVVRIYDGEVLLGETIADQAGYYRFSLPTLAPGAHSIITRVYDANGKLIASSEPVAVTVRGGPVAQVSPTVAATPTGPRPSAQPPVFTGLQPGDRLLAGVPGRLAGTASPGSRIEVFANNKQVGETITGPDGKWSLALPALLPGEYSLVVRAFGSDGAVLGESAPMKVTVVAGTPGAQPTAGVTVTAMAAATATKPPAPAFTGLQDGAQLLAGVPGQLTGIAAPGTKIEVYDGDRKIGETTAGADGKWSLALPALTTGVHALTARAVGPDGVVQATSEPIKVIVGAAPEATKPGGTATAAAAPATITAVAAATVAAAAPVTATVAAAAPVTATAAAAAAPVTATVAAAAPVTATAAAAAAPVTATVAAAAPVTATVAAAAPAAVTAAAPTATTGATVTARTPSPGAAAPPEQGVTVAEGMPLHLTGTAAAGAVLRIYDGEKFLGEAVADAAGQWNLIIPPLAVGTHSLTARVYDASGRLVSSSAPLMVTVLPEVGAAATSPTPGRGTPAAEATPAAAAAETAVSSGAPQTPAHPVPTPQISSPRPGAELTTTSPGVLEGTGEPGSTVRIYDGDKLVAELRVGPDGRWQLALPILGEGLHALTARIVAPDGSEIASQVLSVTVKPAPLSTSGPAAPAKLPAGKPSVSSPKTGATVMSAQPLLSGRAGPGVTVRIYDGNTLLGETTADARGNWHFIPPFPLGVGKHVLRVASLLPDGTELPGDVIQVIVTEDATGFSAITFVRAYGKAPSQVGILQGTAPPGTIVRVYDGGALLGRVQVDANGNWQFALTLRTKAGPHEYGIAAVTPDGVVVYRSEPIEVIIK